MHQCPLLVNHQRQTLQNKSVILSQILTIDITSIPKTYYLLNIDKIFLQQLYYSCICSFSNYFTNFSNMLGNRLYQTEMIAAISSINQIIWSTPALSQRTSLSLPNAFASQLPNLFNFNFLPIHLSTPMASPGSCYHPALLYRKSQTLKPHSIIALPPSSFPMTLLPQQPLILARGLCSFLPGLDPFQLYFDPHSVHSSANMFKSTDLPPSICHPYSVTDSYNHLSL